MTLRMAWRSLVAQPVRTAVLVVGFGAGIAAMAGLLGVGDVILEQSRAPELRGGGDLVIIGVTGPLTSARFLATQVLANPPLAGFVTAVSPSTEATLYLVGDDGETTAVTARGGIPGLERGVGDGETSGVEAWKDLPVDVAWSSPDPGDVLRALDRFHPVPTVPARAGSWAEWLYFNGRGDDAAFYLTFLVGPHDEAGRRVAGIRLQLERDGRVVSYVGRDDLDEAELLATAPEMTIGGSTIRLDGMRYVIDVALHEQDRLLREEDPGAPDLEGRLVLEAVPGRALPPLEISGADGWVSGYVVPVPAGDLEGSLRVGGETISFDGARGYHDHNWGFWEGVTWQWGKVAGDGVSFVYGRVRPPADAADPERMPGFMMALGPAGPLGHAIAIDIDEEDDPELGHPRSIRVVAQGSTVDVTMEIDVTGATRTPLRGPFADVSTSSLELVQMRATYRVSGRVADRELDFTADGSAETFRGE